jgi:predicted permease
MTGFTATFLVMFRAMLQLLLIAVLAGFLVRRKWVSQEQIRSLAAITVNVLLPCMIFVNIARQFNPGATPGWWMLPILAVAISSAGLLMAWLLFRRELPRKNLMLAMAALQNSGYMALPLGKMAYPDQFDRFALFTFLFILGYSPFLWSVGKHLTTAEGASLESSFRWRGLITPPFCANLAAVALVLVGAAGWIPSVVLESVDLLGSATVPVATFVLGATVGGIALSVWPPWADAVRAIGVKLVLLPGLMVTVLTALTAWTPLRVEPLLGNFLVIQAASAPATALALQVRKYGGDAQQTGSMLLISYTLCLVTLPLWLGLWCVMGQL